MDSLPTGPAAPPLSLLDGGCLCLSCSGARSIHSALTAPLINDLLSVLYGDWLPCHTLSPNFAPSLTLLRTPACPPFISQRHNTTTRLRLNINADTNNKCTNKDYNIETVYMFARNINSWSVIHRPLFLFIPSFLQPCRCLEGRPQSCLWGEKEREREEKGRKSNLG